MTDYAILLKSVSRVYGKGQSAVTALRDVTVGCPRGSFTAVMGPSGSGKSTFLHCAAGLDRPTRGSVVLGGVELSGLKEAELTKLRRERAGFVFQAFNLVPALDVAENIALPLRLAGKRVDPAWIRQVAAQVGLQDRMRHRPPELSGGQQQRVAIARALVMKPDVVFGDEPTGALDTTSGRQVLTLLRDAARSGHTVVMVTHDPSAAAMADRVVFLADGRLVGELEQPTLRTVASRMAGLGAWVEGIEVMP
ncbi:ABC transporter [Actinosynnema sp. ALI-1.44]|nr:ABC transporter [Actinosynnema sp. ALI-1.44]